MGHIALIRLLQSACHGVRLGIENSFFVHNDEKGRVGT